LPEDRSTTFSKVFPFKTSTTSSTVPSSCMQQQ
jgi:hypothetical protein